MSARQTVQCARCGRALSASRSVARGVGPGCARRIARRAPAVLSRVQPAQARRALELISAGGVETDRTDGQLRYRTVSSDGRRHYATTPVGCTCTAARNGQDCYHRLAVALVAA